MVLSTGESENRSVMSDSGQNTGVGSPSLLHGIFPTQRLNPGFLHCRPILLSPQWTSLVDQLVKNLPAMRDTWVQFLGWEDLWRRERLPTPVFWPREFHGLYSPWGHKESDITEQLSLKLMVLKLLVVQLKGYHSFITIRNTDPL